MSYFVVCSFDLKNASYQDYQNAYADLGRIGLSRSVTSSAGKGITLPTTMTAGAFNGTSAGGVCESIMQQVRAAFSARGFSAEIFVNAGGDWSWRHHKD